MEIIPCSFVMHMIGENDYIVHMPYSLKWLR